MAEKPTPAQLTRIDSAGKATGAPIKLQFNPSSLQYVVENQLVEAPAKNGANNNKAATQFVTESTAKLTMDLVFDTTDTGQNVCNQTVEIARLMTPTGASEGGRTAPSFVKFEWGYYAFDGYIAQFRETIDFFHADGVPLRSTVNLTLTAQSIQFEQGGGDGASTSSSAQELPRGQNPQSLASQGDNPKAARAVAAQNGQESLRFSKGPLTVTASVQTRGPAGFASGGAGVGGGLGAGIGASAARVSFGGSSSAGVSASAGAFAGIGASASAKAGASYSLNLNKLLPAPGTNTLSLGAGAGAAGAGAGIGISAGAGIGVGAGGSLNAAGQVENSSGGPVRVTLTANGKEKILFDSDR